MALSKSHLFPCHIRAFCFLGWCEDGGDRGGLHWSIAHSRTGSHESHGDFPTEHYSPVCAGESSAGGSRASPSHSQRARSAVIGLSSAG